MAPACCPPGSWPQLLLTTSNEELNKDDAPSPRGEIVSLPVEGQDDLPLYFVSAADGVEARGSVLVLPDIYSVRYLLPEVRSGDRIGSISDALSDMGYDVGLAGIFRGEPYDRAVEAPGDGDFLRFDAFAPDGGVPWIQSNSYDKMGPCVKAAVACLKEKQKKKNNDDDDDDESPLGVIGYCFGSWLLSKASSTGDVDFDCAIGCHPATVLEKAVFGGDEETMMDGLRQPSLFLWAGNDAENYTGDDGHCKKAVEKTGGKVVEFPDMLHGWISRGDVSDDAVKAGVDTALTEIRDFLEEHMTPKKK